jgi:hypothetical protein
MIVLMGTLSQARYIWLIYDLGTSCGRLSLSHLNWSDVKNPTISDDWQILLNVEWWDNIFFHHNFTTPHWNVS